MYAGKIKLWCKGYFSHLRQFLANSNDDNVRKWVSNLVLKFHDDPTVNKLKIVILLRQVWVYMEKIKDFGKGRIKDEIEKKKKRKDVLCVWKLT